MKTPLFLAILGLSPLLLHAGANDAAPAPQAAIPLDQIGATAQKQYSGDGISITSTANGARLRAAFQKMEGEVTREGLLLKSTIETQAGDESFRVRAIRVGRDQGNADTHVHLAESGTVEVAADVVRYIRDGLVEEYRVSMDGVRQDFIVLDRPAGGGALGVTLHLTGAQAEAASYGARVTLHGSGREIAYSRLHVTDATGKELPARMEVTAPDRLALIVDDTAATYPVRIDPTFSDADWFSMGNAGDYRVNDLAISGTNLYIATNHPASQVRIWDGSQWTSLPRLPSPEFNSGIAYCILVSGSSIYIGGSFAFVDDGVTSYNVARWDGTQWRRLNTGVYMWSSMRGEVRSLAYWKGSLYAGGLFLTRGGDTNGVNNLRSIARWTGGSWEPVGYGLVERVASGMYVGGVTKLCAHEDDLYAAGPFIGAFTASGVDQSVGRFARWNGTAWIAPPNSWSGTYNGIRDITDLLSAGGDLYASGIPAISPPSTAFGVARLRDGVWTASSPLGPICHEIAMLGTELYVACGLYGVMKWDGVNTWIQLGSPPLTATGAGSVEKILISGTNLYAGGEFISIGGKASTNLARATLVNTASPYSLWAASTGADGPGTTPSATPHHDGVPNLLKYAFNMNGAGPDVQTMVTIGNSGLPNVSFPSGPSLRIEFVRRIGSGLVYTPKMSATLAPGSWMPLPSPIIIVTPIDATWERAVYEQPIDTFFYPQCFGTVEVTLP